LICSYFDKWQGQEIGLQFETVIFAKIFQVDYTKFRYKAAVKENKPIQNIKISGGF